MIGLEKTYKNNLQAMGHPRQWIGQIVDLNRPGYLNHHNTKPRCSSFDHADTYTAAQNIELGGS